jgi:hypothetical protein
MEYHYGVIFTIGLLTEDRDQELTLEMNVTGLFIISDKPFSVMHVIVCILIIAMYSII